VESAQNRRRELKESEISFQQRNSPIMQKNSLAFDQNFEEYVTSVKNKSENLIKKVFPNKNR